jgi:antitoxin (DNA-binding transcriptional repressor) of toxin-antitoxin stability system
MSPMVLSVKEARPNLPQLIKRTTAGEEIHMGAHQKDQATLIASDTLAEFKRLAQIAQRLLAVLSPEVVQEAVGASLLAQPDADPWAGLKQSLRRAPMAQVTTESASPTASPGSFRRTPSEDEGAEVQGTTWATMEARGTRGNRPGDAGEPRRPFRSAAVPAPR